MRVIDLDNVVVLALGEALTFFGVLLTVLSFHALESAKSFRREALAHKLACIDFKASGDRAYNDAKAILRDWERKSGQIAPGLIREEPPEDPPPALPH